MKFMVSFKLMNGSCGNQCFFTLCAAATYIKENLKEWASHSLFTYKSGLAITELIPLKLA